MIDSKELSVVVQGAVNDDTIKLLKSIRKFLPKSEVILSTWKGSNIDKFGGLYDILVLSDDPGAVVFDDLENKTNSLNRILISSQNGIARASRKYILRLRSDLVLKNNNVLKLIDDFNIRNKDYSLFKQRILAYENFSIKYGMKNKIKQIMLFHISDWCYLGLKEDLEELFNISLVAEPEFSRYFDTHIKKCSDIFPERQWKMSPEQYFTSSNAKKVCKELSFRDYLDVNDENVNISETFIINNFRVFSPKEWGIVSLKKQYKHVNMICRTPFSYYSRFEQLKDYKKFCHPNIVIKPQRLSDLLWTFPYYENLRKHFWGILYCSPGKKISELISLLYYLLLFIFSLIKEVICKRK